MAVRNTLYFPNFNASGTGAGWGPANSTPPFPSGYTQGGEPAKITDTNKRFGKFNNASSNNTVIVDNTPLTGPTEIVSEIILGPVGGDSQGPSLSTLAGTGFAALINTSNGIRIWTLTAFGLGAQVGIVAFTATTGHVCRFRMLRTSGTQVTLEVLTGPVGGPFVSRLLLTGVASTNTDWYAGCFVRNQAEIVQLTSEYTAAQSITSINGASNVKAGQSAIPFVTSGYTGLATSVTSNQSGLTFGSIAGVANNFTAAASGYVEGGQYPAPGTSALITVAYNAETAGLSKVIDAPNGYVVQAITGAVTSDDTYPAFYWARESHTVEGAQAIYLPYGDLTMGPDSKITVTDEGVLYVWLRPTAGPTAGRTYEFILTIREGGDVIDMLPKLQARKFRTSGLSAKGLRAVKL